MEQLGVCANNMAEYTAGGMAVLFLIGTVVVFAIRRTLTSMCYGLLATCCGWMATMWLVPHLVFFGVIGTFGLGSVFCEGFW